MIQTWMADVSSLLNETRYMQYYHMLPGHRREKADMLLKQEDKALSAGAWILFQKMEKYYSLHKGAVYNLSHSGTCVLCSVDDSGSEKRKLGCDLEKIKEMKWKVAERFFCDAEYRSIMEKETEEQQKELFYRYWVLKESFMKATRLGMKLGMDQFEIGFGHGEKPYLRRQPAAFPDTYYFQEYTVLKMPYRIAVCSDCGEFAPDIPFIEL